MGPVGAEVEGVADGASDGLILGSSVGIVEGAVVAVKLSTVANCTSKNGSPNSNGTFKLLSS